jgi:uncharacterized protein (TIGR02246 family)
LTGHDASLPPPQAPTENDASVRFASASGAFLQRQRASQADAGRPAARWHAAFETAVRCVPSSPWSTYAKRGEPDYGFSGSREIVDAFETALNAKDAEALGELFAEDAEFVNIVGMRMRRREGIVAGHAWAFGGPLGGSRISFDQVDELPVTDDVTVLHAHCVRERLPDAPPQTLPAGRSVLVFVTRRNCDGWQAVAATNVTEAPPAETD